ncbi:MAG: carbamoyl-phosphate synthase large subunit [Candidatus Binatus sp.]|uniref:carbamoyl-phosphate synthase large subunit n=1 Tax=Candidatus Binatus sp. TaxID=2811406 RepID=UPI002721B54C|nr:carbamoyl-phosphate synthase large subunit [Candidatus Binatus sp.]MDO8431049.1 carbamoyl-phosphate synthase large subunit [Candidatus Binatus sp.]
MPLRKDLKSVLLIGSGPIVIGQACEFDYSGTQAAKALREEGLRLILVNSNPATIMTDPELADRTYIEPMTAAVLTKIIERERPDSLLPTVGGQTALNLAIELAETGVLDRFKCELIGAKLPAIKKAEDRDLFKQAMLKIGLEVPRSAIAHSASEARRILDELGLPLIIRPSRTLGGTGGSIARDLDDYHAKVAHGLEQSPSHEVLIEQSIEGWKEFELEVMRDCADNVVIVCSIENLDPMGVHTGDSITVAPAQTLTDKEYQLMRDAALRIIREIGVDTGGANIQFAIEPGTGRMAVIEMNPRVSRSSALASKATGFPIAKIAARLAVGYRLDEIPNDITRMTPACFEPTIDYVVTKIPRFTFEKFRGAVDELGPQMKSVGEAMAIGRTFKESLQKALRSLEIGSSGFESRLPEPSRAQSLVETRRLIAMPSSHRLYHLADALRLGMSRAEAAQLSKIDGWFIDAVADIVGVENRIAAEPMTEAFFREFKAMGFSDRRIAELRAADESSIASHRREAGVLPVYKSVDTCGAEFEAFTPYLYSTYEGEDEVPATARRKVMILGGGPNRIGQGIEFDYCCVHASLALKEAGFETIMVNCNPETVSTDYDISDRLYFEPLTFEDVIAIAEREKPFGVIVQFGGQTPLKLAVPLERAGVPILGTSPDAIDRAEDRERFNEMVSRLGLRQPYGILVRGLDDAVVGASKVGYPVLIRPSYVLGGRAMEVIPNEEELRRYVTQALQASERHPLLVDRYLQGATEVDVDAISDGEIVVIGGIMEHVEHAGIHSGDSACALPPNTLSAEIQIELSRQTKMLARELGVVGLINVQFAIFGGEVFILEVNPRASRTIPFVSKAIGVPLAKYAALAMAGMKLSEIGFTAERVPAHVAVKESVFPFGKFPGVDTILGPEMKSTGEVMGIDATFAMAFAKAELAASSDLPDSGFVFISVRDEDKQFLEPIVRGLAEMRFQLIATDGTSRHIRDLGLQCESVNKVLQGGPHIVDAMKEGRIAMVINTPDASGARDSFSIRRTALELRLPYFTTMAGAKAAVEGIRALKTQPFEVRALQDYHRA